MQPMELISQLLAAHMEFKNADRFILSTHFHPQNV
jgi:hypothetical protein